MNFVVLAKEMGPPGHNPSVSAFLQCVEVDCRLSPAPQVGSAGL